jgi:hypothetical protein
MKKQTRGGYFDFSTFKNIVVPETCKQAAGTASCLIQDDNFFESTICKVLTDIAKDAGLSEPTPEETRSIRDNLRYEVHVTEDPDTYMQCLTYTADIFINSQVFIFCVRKTTFNTHKPSLCSGCWTFSAKRGISPTRFS